MKEASIFLIIFGVLIVLAAIRLYTAKDPRKSMLTGRIAGIEKMSMEKAKELSRNLAWCLGGVGLAIIVFFVRYLLV